jgi:hypothetical protein
VLIPQTVVAENLLLRKQLAFHVERCSGADHIRPLEVGGVETPNG